MVIVSGRSRVAIRVSKMDFKPYTEVVLPAKKTKFDKRKERAERSEPKPPPRVREFKRPGDFIHITDEPSSSAPPRVETHVVPGTPRVKDEGGDHSPPSPAPPLEDAGAPASTAPAPAPVAAEEEPTASFAVPAATPETTAAVETVTVSPAPAAHRAKADRESPPAAPKDFIIAYDGIFIGHYCSAKRITNRTAFRNVAARLRDEIADFRLEKLALYRPVPLKVDPTTIEGLGDESFEWFSGGE